MKLILCRIHPVEKLVQTYNPSPWPCPAPQKIYQQKIQSSIMQALFFAFPCFFIWISPAFRSFNYKTVFSHPFSRNISHRNPVPLGDIIPYLAKTVSEIFPKCCSLFIVCNYGYSLPGLISLCPFFHSVSYPQY